ncbi:CPBP family intramembrane metalloprotease [Candidatus Saccharibacteria bacterium]|nr:CPBP family intramembrane metalloprotease [Candidatus Saccharibacteria bacterium]
MAENKKNWLTQKIEAIKKRARKDEAYKKRMVALWAIALTVWVGAIIVVAQFVVSLVATIIIKGSDVVVDANSAVLEAVLMVIVYVMALVLIILPPLYLLNSKVSRDSLGLKGLPTWTDILLAPIGYIASMVATIAVLLVVQAVAPSFDLNEAQDVGFNGIYLNIDKAIAFVALVVLAPIAEELIFRGYLYGKLRTRLSAIPAIILVSVLFGLMHGQWNVGIVVGVMSVFLCVARELTGTIYAGILMHMIRNGLAFYLLYVNPISTTSMVGTLGVALPIIAPFLL